MRFKGTFTEEGKSKLEKHFLPTLDKFGKQLEVLVGDKEANFIQTPLQTDGPLVSVRINSDVLFHGSDYRIASKHHDLIAFSLELGLLLRVLRSASTSIADKNLEVKLTQKAVTLPGEEEPVNRPFLTFNARNESTTLSQDLPISQPYTHAEVDRLVASKQEDTMSAYYLDIFPVAADLQAMVDKMKTISDTVILATCKNGDLYADVSAVNVQLGVQLQNLQVLPAEMQPSVEVNRQLPVREQLTAAVEAGDASSIELPIKHLARMLQVHAMSNPSKILVGVGATGAHLHVMFVYPDLSGTGREYDDSTGLFFRLPASSTD